MCIPAVPVRLHFPESTVTVHHHLRSDVRASWDRAHAAHVDPALDAAPMVWDEDALMLARRDATWLPLALHSLTAQRGAYSAAGSIVALFDASGRMLHSEGEARALDGLGGINFRPGSAWSEDAVGTNGPGTALATGRPVHIVGAEHFCEQWQGWHCAAVPLRDPLTGAVNGALDVSGFRQTANPHTLMLVVALGAAIEQMLSAREAQRRAFVLERFAMFAARWPGECLVAVDRAGTILSASAAPAALHPLAPISDGACAAFAQAVAASSSEQPRAVSMPSPIDGDVVFHPVLHHGTVAGACMLVPRRESSRVQVASRLAMRPVACRGREATRYTLDDIVGDSRALRDAHRLAIAAASNTLPVLLLGESGTGKEMFAQGIHAASDRAARPFIAVNCAALPADLVESELFGYVGGAFSGARREGAIGKFEAANGGTILLDEVGDLPLPAQAALLRVLQEGEVTRVGATRGTPVDVRVIAATNTDVDVARRNGTFRDDLFYRLGVLSITLPPLRERRSDIERLATRFLADAGAELGRTGHSFAPATLDALRASDWPGNIRELKNVIWRVVALARSSVITPESLPAEMRGGGAATSASNGPSCPSCGEPAAAELEVPAAIAPDDDERERLVRAIEGSRNMGEAAQILGVARSTLYRQMARHGVQAHRVVER
jgi:sigma-54 dependent transcriptional regulator, acetoin dehydrogenase operon transcriptional activator AcoR